MSNRRNAILMGGTLALLVGAGTAAAVAGADDSRATTATSTSTTGTSISATFPEGTSISVRPTTTSPSSTTSAGSSSDVVGGVSAAEAERIAIARAGGGRVVRTERELEHGRWEWHVRVEGAGGRYDIRVDAEAGSVTWSGGDDRGGHRGRGGDDH
jgi:peptidase YpeB-like protein